MNVNQKGVKGLIKVIEDLADSGFYTFPAFDDHSPIDIIACDKNGRTYRLQVKYREPVACRKSDRYELTARSIINGKQVPIDKNMIDGWAIYMSNRNRVIYIPVHTLDNVISHYVDPDRDYGRLAEWPIARVC